MGCFNKWQVSMLFLLCPVILLFSLTGFRVNPPAANSLDSLKRGFENPDKAYGTVPFWVWNTKVTHRMIDSMIVDYKRNGFGGLIIHPRPGLVNEYLSDNWFELFGYAVKKGKGIGLDIWMYDENSYPTGFAGGLLPEQMPESYNQGQMLHLKKVSALPENIDNIFICVKEDNGTLTDITSALEVSKGKAGNFYLFTKDFYKKSDRGMLNGPLGSPYVDLMVKGVTEKFIDITFKGYEKVAGNEFGKTVVGVFSDEPSIPARGPNNIRWTPDLFSEFEKKWGYDLQVNLPSLFEEIGDWKKVRHNYISTLSQLFIDRWSKPMFAYTEKHKLKWTGHYWEHGWPNPEDVPDNMAMYAFHQYPGIDMLFNQFDDRSPNAQFGNIRSVKELASVANQLGKKRTLSETYGASGWDLTFKDMKRLADWQYALGVNLLNQHLSYMTITGSRKYDHPPSFSYHTPWWQYYKYLNQYYKRLSYAMCQGSQLNDILVLEPTTSAWMYTFRNKPNKRRAEIGVVFQDFIIGLEKAHVEYDLGSENIIKDHGKVENRSFIVGERAYKTVIIPPGMDNIDSPTFNLLKQFIEQGGKVLKFAIVLALDGKADKRLEFLNENSTIIQPLKNDQSFIQKHLQRQDFAITKSNTTEGGNLYHHRRKMGDGQLIFLANSNMEYSATGHLSVMGKDALVMDLFTGNILDYPEENQGDKVEVNFNVPPAGSLLLFISNSKQPGFPKLTIGGKRTLVNSSSATVVRPVENTLTLDFCDVRLKDIILVDKHVVSASNSVYKYHGFNEGVGNPWNNQTQFRNQITARDTFSTGTGFRAIYRFSIDKGVNYKQFRAVVEQGKLWNSIKINDVEVSLIKNQWWLDKSFGITNIGPYLKPGENSLSIEINPMSVFAEIEPVYILGNFNLQPINKGFQIVTPKPLMFGNWDEQGLPLYGNGVKYIKNIGPRDRAWEYELALSKWNGTAAVVRVNNRFAGIITSEPNTLNISSFLTKKVNSVEVEVLGSLRNVLGPHHNSPPKGLAGPGHWNVKSHPPGKDYKTVGYGLMEDFQVFKYLK